MASAESAAGWMQWKKGTHPTGWSLWKQNGLYVLPPIIVPAHREPFP